MSFGGQQSAVDVQYQGTSALLQLLDKLESSGTAFFDSLDKVGQGPPSLLAAQLVAMSQACQQMAEDAQAAALLNVPSGPASEVFAQPACVLPRSGTGAQRVLGDAQALETWVAETGRQTSELFAERRRLTANVQAALSVPPPKQLELK